MTHKRIVHSQRQGHHLIQAKGGWKHRVRSRQEKWFETRFWIIWTLSRSQDLVRRKRRNAKETHFRTRIKFRTQIGLGKKKNLSYVNENTSILSLSCKKVRSTLNWNLAAKVKEPPLMHAHARSRTHTSPHTLTHTYTENHLK